MARRKKSSKKAPRLRGEFEGASLGDPRLERRLLLTIGKLNANPGADTLNGTFKDWARTKAAYRFFDNENCEAKKLIEPRVRRTVARMKNYGKVLVVSDTTFVNYNGLKKTAGLGSIGRYSTGKEHSRGLILHVTYAIAPEGLPLGILSIKSWARPPEGYGDGDSEAREKESRRWLEEMENASALCPAGTKMVYVADRESDIYGVHKKATELGIDFVVRSKHNRRTKGDGTRMEDAINAAPPLGKTSVEINTPVGKRNAAVEVGYSRMEIARPGDAVRKCSANKGYLDIGLVSVREVDGPDKGKNLDRRLLTNLSCDDLESCLAVVGIYKKRWLIELLFKVAKSGCKIEACRLQNADRIIRYLNVMFVIAWRLSWKVYVARVNPEGDKSLVVSDLEYKTLWIMLHCEKIKEGTMSRDPPKDSPWNAKETVIAMAKLGGFNGRRGDGMPGMQKIWEGWIALQHATLATEALL